MTLINISADTLDKMLDYLKQTVLAIFLGTLLAACSSIGLSNPFGAKDIELSRVPANATEYRCENNQYFYVRMLNSGADAWLIYPDHEVNLTRSAGSTSRYTSGVITLELNGENTTLNDGDKVAYAACKPQVKK